jgi:hypothetical protein
VLRRPGETLLSFGVDCCDLKMPLDAFAAGLGDHRTVASFCSGGNERRRRRLMSVIASGQVDLAAMTAFLRWRARVRIQRRCDCEGFQAGTRVRNQYVTHVLNGPEA